MREEGTRKGRGKRGKLKSLRGEGTRKEWKIRLVGEEGRREKRKTRIFKRGRDEEGGES